VSAVDAEHLLNTEDIRLVVVVCVLVVYSLLGAGTGFPGSVYVLVVYSLLGAGTGLAGSVRVFDELSLLGAGTRLEVEAWIVVVYYLDGVTQAAVAHFVALECCFRFDFPSKFSLYFICLTISLLKTQVLQLNT